MVTVNRSVCHKEVVKSASVALAIPCIQTGFPAPQVRLDSVYAVIVIFCNLEQPISFILISINQCILVPFKCLCLTHLKVHMNKFQIGASITNH